MLKRWTICSSREPSAPNDVTNTNSKYMTPLVFMRESEIFGNRRPDRNEWIQHVEVYKAIGQKINVSHITGLQRVRGLWRIYLDNIEDKVTLMAEGVPLRGKNVQVLNTNPDRFDGEQTTRVRVKNVPLSVEDGLIKRTITLKEVEVISMYREKLRVDNKLTNCETGDRIIIVKSSSLKEPLPMTMSFGHIIGRVLHIGQQKNVKSGSQKCSKCLQDGHSYGSCTNEWVCTFCNKSGHKRADCKAEEKTEPIISESSESSEPESSDSESSDSEDTAKKIPKKIAKPAKVPRAQSTSPDKKKVKSVRAKRRGKDNCQQPINKYMTPQRGRSANVPDRSPPTPAEELHDKEIQNNNNKKQKK